MKKKCFVILLILSSTATQADTLNCMCEYHIDHFSGSKASVAEHCRKRTDSLSTGEVKIQSRVFASAQTVPFTVIYKCVAALEERLGGANKDEAFSQCKNRMKKALHHHTPSPRFVSGFFEFNTQRLALKNCHKNS